MTKNNHTASNSYFDLKCYKILSNDFPDKIQNHTNFNKFVNKSVNVRFKYRPGIVG